MCTLRAIVRDISERFSDAVTMHASQGDINVSLARTQHAAYVAALRALAVDVTVLAADSDQPDCVFVEDQAVVAGGMGLITRSGNAGRRAEAVAVASALDPFMPLNHMAAPATLDGGDVLRVGRVLFVGRSARTSAGGVEALTETFGPHGFAVVEVTVSDALHLKCHCSTPGPGVVLLAPDRVPAGAFSDFRVLEVPPQEAYAANVVGVNGSVLVPAGYDATRAVLEGAGFDVVVLDTSEIAKADGSLTCMSLFF